MKIESHVREYARRLSNNPKSRSPVRMSSETVVALTVTSSRYPVVEIQEEHGRKFQATWTGRTLVQDRPLHDTAPRGTPAQGGTCSPPRPRQTHLAVIS